MRDPYILATLRARPWARSPQVLEHLQVEAAARGAWANSWGYEAGRYRIDAETGHLDLVLRLGLLDRIELGLLVPVEVRGGGALDGFLEGFHDLFGLPQADRKVVSRDRYEVAGLEEDGEPYALAARGAAFADLTLEGRALLTRGGPRLPALTLTGRLRLPTGRRAFGYADGVDATLQLDASKRLGDLPVVLYTSLAYTHYGDTRAAGLTLARHRLYFSIGGEWELLPTLSLVAHAWIESRRELRAFDEPAPRPSNYHGLLVGNWVTYIAVGFKWRPLPWLGLEAGLLENVVDPDTTSDVAFLVGATFRL